MYWLVLLFWFIAGILTLSFNKDVSKFEYAVCYITLLFFIFGAAMGWN